MKGRSEVEVFFRAMAGRKGDSALVDCIGERRFSYAELEDLSSRAAAELARRVGPGDRVALFLPNSAELLVTYLACMRLGVVSAPINSSFSPREVETILELAEPKLIITDRATSKGLPPGEVTRLHWDDGELSLATLGARIARDSWPADDGLAHLMFSSGTTGAPKVIPIRATSILGHAAMFAKSHGLDSSSKFYNVLPLAYLGGWYNLALVPLQAGGAIVLDREFGMAGIYRYWTRCLENGVNCVWFTPSMLAALAAAGVEDEEQKRAIASSIRWSMVGMAALPPALKARFEGGFGLSLQQSYGLSETFLFTSWVNETDTPADSVGRVLPGYDVRIVDGEIQVKGDWISGSYWRQPALTQSAYTGDGYFRTGDLGRVEADGRVYITGRRKDLIIRGGVNISPGEIEEVALKLDGVLEAAAVGVPDELYGERIVLFVRVTDRGPAEREVTSHCRANLSASKVPSTVMIIPAMPLNSSGKIQKSELRKLAQRG